MLFDDVFSARPVWYCMNCMCCLCRVCYGTMYDAVCAGWAQAEGRGGAPSASAAVASVEGGGKSSAADGADGGQEKKRGTTQRRCVYLCVFCALHSFFRHQHPAHPASVPIRYPREVQALWSLTEEG